MEREEDSSKLDCMEHNICRQEKWSRAAGVQYLCRFMEWLEYSAGDHWTTVVPAPRDHRFDRFADPTSSTNPEAVSLVAFPLEQESCNGGSNGDLQILQK